MICLHPMQMFNYVFTHVFVWHLKVTQLLPWVPMFVTSKVPKEQQKVWTCRHRIVCFPLICVCLCSCVDYICGLIYIHHTLLCVSEVKLCSGVGDCIKTDPLINCNTFSPTGRNTDRFNIQCVMYSFGFKTNSSGSVLALP